MQRDASLGLPTETKLSLEIEGHTLSPRREYQYVWAFLLIGLVARMLRYVLRFPLWEDECFLCVNFIDRNYAELLDPLQYHQVAPVFFLWIELSLVKLFGYSEMSLRLFAFVCSISSLFLFRHLARRLLAGWPLVFSMAIFSVSYPGIRYAAEAKQYASDMLVGMVFLAMAVEWWRSSSKSEGCTAGNRWLIGLAAFTPFAIGLSYPAVFAAGGVSLFVASVLLHRQRSDGVLLSSWLRNMVSDRRWQEWTAFNVLLVASFLVLLLFAARNQNSAELDWMGTYWKNAFPPMSDPLKLPLWFLTTHTGDLLAFPIGGGRGASTLTFISVVLGIGCLVRRRAGLCLMLLLASPTLHLVAAAMERYPYGGHVKFSQHMAAIICMLSGLGTAALAAWMTKHLPKARQMAPAIVVYFLLIAVASMARDSVRPFKTKSDMRARAFAKWFWFNASFDGEAVCVKDDLGRDFSPDSYRELSWVAQYLVNKEIYTPKTGTLDERLAKVGPDHPLRCVIYRDLRFDYDEAAQTEWLAEMKLKYDLAGSEKFAFPRYGKHEKRLGQIDYLEMYKFVPKPEANVASRAEQAILK